MGRGKGEEKAAAGYRALHIPTIKIKVEVANSKNPWIKNDMQYMVTYFYC